MYILTKNGELIEGTLISSNTEKALVHFKKSLDDGELGYFHSADRRKLLAFLAQNYEMFSITAPQAQDNVEAEEAAETAENTTNEAT